MTAAYGRVYQNVTRRPDIPLPAKGVYCYLASMANRDGSCYPSVETMCAELKVYRHTLEKHLRLLVKAGVITKERRRAAGKQTSNVYHINSAQTVHKPPVENQPVENQSFQTVQNAPTNKNIKEQYISGFTRWDSFSEFSESAGQADLPEIQEIISYLNAQAGTSYRAGTKATQQHIRARLREGFTVADFQCVIDQKCADWGRDARMAKYLRPETLFGAKFESYLQEAETTRRAREADEPVFFTEGGIYF